jgi:hypothetical protein
MEFEDSLQCGVQGLGINIDPKEYFALHIGTYNSANPAWITPPRIQAGLFPLTRSGQSGSL